ncbi:MAG: hypothetical protein ACXVH3_23810 [Solirubrobacteraceae bacterium]
MSPEEQQAILRDAQRHLGRLRAERPRLWLQRSADVDVLLELAWLNGWIRQAEGEPRPRPAGVHRRQRIGVARSAEGRV